jgi:hypothetical protein
MSSAEKTKKNSPKGSSDSAGSGKKKEKSAKSQKHGESVEQATGSAAVLSKAKLPAAAAGALLVSLAGAATIRKSRKPKPRKSRLLRKAIKNPSPMIVLVRGGARGLKKLAPGS